MTATRRQHIRASVIVVALAAAVATTPIIASAIAASEAGAHVVHGEPRRAGDSHDFDFLVGHWTVQHRRLKERLAGSAEWEKFNGTIVNWPTLGGLGNVSDNVLELPGGTYRGVGMRAFDAKTGLWSIWWLDARNPTIDPPIRGSFKDGVGIFLGDDALNGRPIKVRVRWSQITPTSAHWEQAFSSDGGKTWETNWITDFTRVR